MISVIIISDLLEADGKSLFMYDDYLNRVFH